ncbi:MAG: hypothetical protein QXS16_04350 [Pyrobaculum sp.]
MVEFCGHISVKRLSTCGRGSLMMGMSQPPRRLLPPWGGALLGRIISPLWRMYNSGRGARPDSPWEAERSHIMI